MIVRLLVLTRHQRVTDGCTRNVWLSCSNIAEHRKNAVSMQTLICVLVTRSTEYCQMQCLCSVRKRFSRDHCCRGRSNSLVNKVYIAVLQFLVKLRPISRTPFGHESDIKNQWATATCLSTSRWYDEYDTVWNISHAVKKMAGSPLNLLLASIQNNKLCQGSCIIGRTAAASPAGHVAPPTHLLLYTGIHFHTLSCKCHMLVPPYLHLATSEMWCWSGGRGT